ncbi:Hypothetical predicted protein [Olea europaea subsp. europaea]|uniref:Uncharacterized protein n=1 Tax=Olea europaea subsp. europaea TaxID=158383 RepID=A0A8S0PVG4_OLEEU|nr:Hypothetical predicted protein [Olea europaea subsp. europaea]
MTGQGYVTKEMVGSGGAAKELPLIQFNRIELRGRRATAKGFPVLHSMGWNAGKGRKCTTLTPFLKKEWSGPPHWLAGTLALTPGRRQERRSSDFTPNAPLLMKQTMPSD